MHFSLSFFFFLRGRGGGCISIYFIIITFFAGGLKLWRFRFRKYSQLVDDIISNYSVIYKVTLEIIKPSLLKIQTCLEDQSVKYEGNDTAWYLTLQCITS